MLLELMMSAVIGLNANPSAETSNEFADAQVIAQRMLEPYRNHPAGDEVLDYHVCFTMDLRNDHALFLERSGIRPSAAQIWDIEPPSLPSYRSNPSEAFTSVYRVAMNTLVLERYGEIGREGCFELFAKHEMSRGAYNAMLDAQRESN